MSRSELDGARRDSHFAPSDYRILASVGSSRRGTDLKGLLVAAGARDHAALELDEINDGISRLLANGYVVKKEFGRIAATGKARRYRMLMDPLGILEWHVVAGHFVRRKMKTGPAYESHYSEEVYQEALLKYRSRVDRIRAGKGRIQASTNRPR